MIDVRVRVQKQLDGMTIQKGAVVEVRPLEPGGTPYQRVAVPVSSSQTAVVSVSPGSYEFLAYLPSGKLISKVVDVGQPVEVVLDGTGSPREWLSWQHFFGNVPGRESLRFRGEQPLPEFAVECWGSLRRDLRPDGEPLDFSLSSAGSTLVVRLRGDLPSGAGCMLVTRGAQTRLCVLPLEWDTHEKCRAEIEAVVAIEEVMSRLAGEEVWSVKVTVRDPALGGVLAYLGANERQSALLLLRDQLEYARAMLQEKYSNPLAAAAGAYLLVEDWLRDDDPEPSFWNRWVESLARFEWLPDGAILQGWIELKRGQDAKATLLDAAGRGLPVYAEGLRLLLDGLTLLAGDDPDPRLKEALARVRGWAWRADPQQVFTTIRLWEV